MDQDHSLAVKQSRERLEQLADLALAQLSGRINDWQLSLRELETLPPPAWIKTRLPPDAVLVLVTPRSVTTYRGTSKSSEPLLWVPEAPSAPPLSDVFGPAERLEFIDQNYSQAIEALRPFIEKPQTHAECMLRIARLERKLDRPDVAFAEYDLLSHETGFSPIGIPYALLAMGAEAEMRPHSVAPDQLRAALKLGRWPIARVTFQYYWDELNHIQGLTVDPPAASVELAANVALLYSQWQEAVRSGTRVSGSVSEPDRALTIWEGWPSHLAALFAPVGWLDTSLMLPANSDDIRWRWLSGGPIATAEPQVVRSLADAQLTGKLQFFSTSQKVKRELNRSLWLGGVSLMLLLVLAGAYASFRGVSRELKVAQLQSDFVSAVSHEFRSPLTSLRGITELLADDRFADEKRRRQGYTFLERETGRLQRLVEDLLDFGRMESGRKQYVTEPHDMFGLVRSAVDELKEDSLAVGWEVEMNLDSSKATINADKEALQRALRNLLENAMKYSPNCRKIWVDGRLNPWEVEVSVRDRGMGIDLGEQSQIFHKFVRGTAAKKAGIKGTGIGLSMVHQIVKAAGGRVYLESKAGAGSTFTILIPLATSGFKSRGETKQ